MPSASTLNLPIDIAYGGSEFYVADYGNNRVLVYTASFSGLTGSAKRVIGQLDFPYWAANLIEGKEFGTIGSGVWGSAILDYSATPPHLYVADTLNNRILGFSNFNTVQNGQKADLVMGQPDFFRAQINYPTNTVYDPRRNRPQLAPSALAVDSLGNLYVADTSNGRVVRYPTPFASSFNGQPDLVLGQSTVNSQITDATSQTMSSPAGLALTAGATPTSGWLAVADNGHNRVLLFQAPFSNGQAAAFAYGQIDFLSTGTGTALYNLSAPRGLAFDPQNRLLVADTGNKRVLAFGAVPPIGNNPTALLALTTGLNTPVAVSTGSNGQFWVADAQQSELLHYPSIDKLPPTYASDTSVPVFAARSAFVDTYDNVLAADGVNRILYFAPQVALVNDANYLPGRALAPGTISSAFPAGLGAYPSRHPARQSNPGTLPLPTILGGAQITVGGVAAPLLYSSASQINFIVPWEAATGGTTNLQVMNPSTGQIYGAAELTLAAASPGLFTVTAQQSGPIAALNQDNTQNSPGNPMPRGQVLQIFATGQGLLPGAPAGWSGGLRDSPTHRLSCPGASRLGGQRRFCSREQRSVFRPRARLCGALAD